MTKFTPGKDTPGSANGISRRGMLKNLGLMLAGGALLAVQHDSAVAIASTLTKPAPAGSGLGSATSSVLMRSMFARHLGETFNVRTASSGSVRIKLSQVRDLGAKVTKAPSSTNAYHESCFSILFRGPAEQRLAQGSYRVEHGVMGSFDLFIVPVSQDRKTAYYEAVFNRRTS